MPEISTESLPCRDRSSNDSQHSLRFNAITIGLAVTAILFVKHINPALLILAGGMVGWFCFRGI